MLEGLREVKSDLKKRKIQLVIKNISPELGVINLSKNASLIVVDRDYLSITRKWRNIVSSKIEKPLFQVDDKVIVPIEETSSKEEYSAATIRSKINRKIDNFLTVFEDTFPQKSSLQMDFNSIDIDDVEKTISDLKIDQSVQKVPYFHEGTSEAKKRLRFFLKDLTKILSWNLLF